MKSGTPATSGNRAASATWLYQPVPAPDFTLRDLDGHEHSLSGNAGHPVPAGLLGLLHQLHQLRRVSSAASSSRATLARNCRGCARPLTKTGVPLLAISVDPTSDQAKVRAAVQGLGLTAAIAGDDVAGTWNILHRYVFDRREDLPLPISFLIDARGEIVKIYRGSMANASILDDIQEHRRLSGRSSGPRHPIPRCLHVGAWTTERLSVWAGAVRAGIRRAGAGRVRTRRQDRPECDRVQQSRHALHEGREAFGGEGRVRACARARCRNTRTRTTRWARSSRRAAICLARSRTSDRLSKRKRSIRMR